MVFYLFVLRMVNLGGLKGIIGVYRLVFWHIEVLSLLFQPSVGSLCLELRFSNSEIVISLIRIISFRIDKAKSARNTGNFFPFVFVAFTALITVG